MRQRRTIPPADRRPTLTPEKLEALALRYVGRYATTRSKLADYLGRKLARAEWAGAVAADPGGLVERLAALGYVDDRAFAQARAGSLARRGYGARRVGADLRAAGIDDDDQVDALAAARERAAASALALARRRRIGPFASSPPDRAGIARAIAILVRAGHDPALARRVAGVTADRLEEEFDLAILFPETRNR